MKIAMVVFGVVALLISSINLFVVLSRTETPLRYRVISADDYDISGLSDVTEAVLARTVGDVGRINVDAGMAAQIAHLFLVDWYSSLRQPYLVFFHEEHGFFSVLADYDYVERVARVAVCGRTGGILMMTTGIRASMPSYIRGW